MIKENFDWRKMMLYLTITNTDLALKLKMKPGNLSAYVNRNYITLGKKKELDRIYGQEFINEFLI